MRETLRHYIETAGMVVIEAEDGEQALDLYRAHESAIALLITDVSLPKLCGDELARRLDKPVVFVTAYSTAQLRREGRMGENARALQKPFGSAALIEAMRETLAR